MILNIVAGQFHGRTEHHICRTRQAQGRWLSGYCARQVVSWLQGKWTRQQTCRRPTAILVSMSRLYYALNIAVKVRVRTTTLDRITPPAGPAPEPMKTSEGSLLCRAVLTIRPSTWMPRRWGRWRFTLLWLWHKREHTRSSTLSDARSMIKRKCKSALKAANRDEIFYFTCILYQPGTRR